MGEKLQLCSKIFKLVYWKNLSVMLPSFVALITRDTFVLVIEKSSDTVIKEKKTKKLQKGNKILNQSNKYEAS